MKNIYCLLIASLLSITACNSGNSSSPPSPLNYPYSGLTLSYSQIGSFFTPAIESTDFSIFTYNGNGTAQFGLSDGGPSQFFAVFIGTLNNVSTNCYTQSSYDYSSNIASTLTLTLTSCNFGTTVFSGNYNLTTTVGNNQVASQNGTFNIPFQTTSIP